MRHKDPVNQYLSVLCVAVGYGKGNLKWLIHN